MELWWRMIVAIVMMYTVIRAGLETGGVIGFALILAAFVLHRGEDKKDDDVNTMLIQAAASEWIKDKIAEDNDEGEI